jgi:hypothetical protein
MEKWVVSRLSKILAMVTGLLQKEGTILHREPAAHMHKKMSTQLPKKKREQPL